MADGTHKEFRRGPRVALYRHLHGESAKLFEYFVTASNSADAHQAMVAVAPSTPALKTVNVPEDYPYGSSRVST
jgi:hypothetical protein